MYCITQLCSKHIVKWLIQLLYKTMKINMQEVCKTRYSTLFAFLEAVDQNSFLFSQKLLIIAAICCNRSVPCVIPFKKMYTFMALSSVLVRDKMKNNIKITASRIANGIVIYNNSVCTNTNT